MAKSGIFSIEGRPVSSHVLLLCNADFSSYRGPLPNQVFIMIVFLFVASVDVGEVARHPLIQQPAVVAIGTLPLPSG